MNQETYIVELGSERMVSLSITPFDTDVDMDDITRIHYDNIVGEILTTSVLLNRVGVLLAEMEEIVARTKLDFDLFYARESETQRRILTSTDYTEQQTVKKVNKPTVSEVESAIILSPNYAVKKRHLFKVQKERDYINSLYWAVKDKSDKIQKMTEKLKPEDFEHEILEGTINGVLVKLHNKTIK